MVVISLGVLFKGFNASKFILYSCILISILLFSLKLDGFVSYSYAYVFLPLWLCNALVFLGAIIGACSFCARPPSRNEIMLRVDFSAMLLTALEHVFLCAFITLVFVKLEFETSFESGFQLPWTIVFCPLFSLSIMSIGIAVWSLRHDKPFEFEFFYAINIVELVFVAFKLDKQIDWSWAVVFIPLWVLLSLSTVGVVYALVLSIVLVRSRHFMPAHRRQHVYSAILHTFLVIPTLLSLILLTAKFDTVQNPEREPEIGYVMVFSPLMVSMFFMILMAIGVGGPPPSGNSSTNVWWFGVRQPLCPFLFEKIPALRTYANVSYRLGGRSRAQPQENQGEERQAVLEASNQEIEEIDSGGRSRRRQEEKTKRSSAQNNGQQGTASGQGADQNILEHGANSAAIRQAMNQYRSEYGMLWSGDIADPD
ncbi:unnamed protein product [Caenorhabditis bovis]|uniref:Uncharacterized protein n=1 Tax=Caenorhabditis bovis TaxID=2654633 RepID=A0A8S1F9W1_9PELO|nr:unnamed protein product [Caenorhabditis bovis]